MIPKGKHDDRSNEHTHEEQETEGAPTIIDQLLAQVQNKDAHTILSESGLAGQLKKRPAERMLAAELHHHLDTEAALGKSGNHRNGSSRKTVTTPEGQVNRLGFRGGWLV